MSLQSQPRPNSGARARLGRDSWLAGALEMLREQGVGAIKVEPLATRLGVTKGSFYWHFRDRDDLLRSLPGYWAESQTEPVIAVAEAAGGGPIGKMRAVLDFLATEDPDRYDNAMRAWAQFDAAVAEAVAAIDTRRVAAVTRLFEDAGLAPADAAFRARLWYFFDVGEHITGDTPDNVDQRRDRARQRLDILTGDLRDPT